MTQAWEGRPGCFLLHLGLPGKQGASGAEWMVREAGGKGSWWERRVAGEAKGALTAFSCWAARWPGQWQWTWESALF